MTNAELEACLRTVAPRLLVVAERHLTRLLRRRIDRGTTTATAIDVPHLVSREELLDDDILNTRVQNEPTGDYLLVADPSDLHVEKLADPDLLRFYWRMLFGVTIFNALRDATRA